MRNIALACQKLRKFDDMKRACDEVLEKVNPESVSGRVLIDRSLTSFSEAQSAATIHLSWDLGEGPVPSRASAYCTNFGH